ncbi:PREDICTED: phosphate transporter PHO1 [Prunus dulcis]|uniref:PREDICTED: phosphate transporter PHO1 n=1 Tax=Prunus dulcis TaxID=3755 RepID=A0A5E4EWH7_PRUDU|nr:phosphate transporter PHO1 homolog 9 [Prunus dulcis]VVA20084.1 PREDICTED: phosphate transporter PHO1 [Prunus dulcis]
MKFGKEFVSQMVPEWQEAYMDYNSLKLLLKDILCFRQCNKVTTPMASTPEGSSLKRRVSLYRAFSGLTSRHRGSPKKKEDEEILVSEEGAEGQWQTMFLMSSDEGGDIEVVFFKRLDEEFNKVINFYKKKVGEVVDEAEELSRQMDALIALRLKVENPLVELGGTDVIDRGSNGVSSQSTVHPTSGRRPGGPQMDVIPEVEMSNEGEMEDEERGSKESKTSDQKGNGSTADIKGFKPPSLEILDHIKINVTPETPVSTVKGILKSSKPDLSFSKKELRKAEEQMTEAFNEFYQKLRLIKSYCFLNQLAFSKIMKKYDKISSRNASKVYLNMVDNSYLGSCDEVTRIMERVEATFIKHFTNGNRREGMKTLRPRARREKHRSTFFLGLFSGVSIALVVAIIVLIHARNIFRSEGRGQYMENIFPLYSLFGFMVLHMLMFSANIYYWRRYRVNYPFIFGFQQGAELGYRQFFLLSSGLAILALAGVLSNLDMEMDPSTKSFRALTELVPLGLVTVVLLIMFCPFNIIYRSSRFFLLQCIFHCLCAPLYKVSLPDFFFADQLTSQVQAFRSLEFYVCYYGWGDFKKRSHNCLDSRVYRSFYFIVAIIPYWIRSLQCLRRLIEEKDGMQGLNGLKYFSTILAVAMRTSFDLKKGMMWKILAITSSAVATIVSTYWDIVIDWGLLRRNSRNPWLRDKLLISNKSVYFIAMVLNVILRLAWMQSVLGIKEVPFVHRTALVAIVACLEIIRRGIWNFFRLENEHLNNVGKFRAFKSVPLPFNYDCDESKSR